MKVAFALASDLDTNTIFVHILKTDSEEEKEKLYETMKMSPPVSKIAVIELDETDMPAETREFFSAPGAAREALERWLLQMARVAFLKGVWWADAKR